MNAVWIATRSTITSTRLCDYHGSMMILIRTGRYTTLAREREKRWLCVDSMTWWSCVTSDNARTLQALSNIHTCNFLKYIYIIYDCCIMHITWQLIFIIYIYIFSMESQSIVLTTYWGMGRLKMVSWVRHYYPRNNTYKQYWRNR